MIKEHLSNWGRKIITKKKKTGIKDERKWNIRKKRLLVWEGMKKTKNKIQEKHKKWNKIKNMSEIQKNMAD